MIAPESVLIEELRDQRATGDRSQFQAMI